MLFHSPEFFALLIASLIIYYIAPRRRLAMLALANAVFYGAAGMGFLLLFVAVTLFTYIAARLSTGRYPKLWLSLILGVNLLNLLFFKYSLFLMETLERITHLDLVQPGSFWSDIAWPIGISFYTFQLIAYAVDVYKRKIEPSRSFIEFWVFLSFYGHLVAGPIMRGGEFLTQVRESPRLRFDSREFRLGLIFLGIGLAKKVFVPDYLGPIVADLFMPGATLEASQMWLASYMFAFQIYFDFSAYSDMAVGIGYLFGFKLHNNFRTPYLSANPSEFWQRWHITLSSWIRDYVYIPLGGSRAGFIRSNFNLFAAMTISGLWHGAAWTYIAWGMYYGVLGIAHKLYSDIKRRLGWNDRLGQSWLYRLFAIAVFFHLTCIGWVLFRAQGMTQALTFIKGMLSLEAFKLAPGMGGYLLLIVFLYSLHIVEYLAHKHSSSLDRWWRGRIPAPARAFIYTVLAILLVLFMKTEQNTFIYFQF